jgi:hypothetical protein
MPKVWNLTKYLLFSSENETLIPTSEKVDTILTIVSTLVEDQKDGPTAEKLRYRRLVTINLLD